MIINNNFSIIRLNIILRSKKVKMKNIFHSSVYFEENNILSNTTKELLWKIIVLKYRHKGICIMLI